MPHQIDAEEMPTTGHALPVEAHEANELQAALSDAHAARLHGFALLLTVGDEPRAAAAAIAALEAGREGVPEMQDPQRAAAWLRREVIGELRRTWPTPHLLPQERRAALGRMGVVEPLISALEGMSAERRAALVAGTIEQMGMADVAAMLDTDTGGAYRAVEGARLDYLTSAGRVAGPTRTTTPGPLAQRIGEIRASATETMPVKESA